MLFKLLKTVIFAAAFIATGAHGLEYQVVGSIGYDSGGDRVFQGITPTA
jgi:hypothetical protein